jgi:hypothetical protein
LNVRDGDIHGSTRGLRTRGDKTSCVQTQ